MDRREGFRDRLQQQGILGKVLSGEKRSRQKGAHDGTGISGASLAERFWQFDGQRGPGPGGERGQAQHLGCLQRLRLGASGYPDNEFPAVAGDDTAGESAVPVQGVPACAAHQQVGDGRGRKRG